MVYLLVIAVWGALAYWGWRSRRSHAARPATRVIGPDDDPEFLRRIGRLDH